ncbi:hypothetical protein F0M18_18145 [Pseudohalioglobus sediminis]|uniref:Uncharacterized protein n=1 Tax=Pseudohalioglobus sediminis TaxID=2606449 RepID=A0A5B0WPM8_9GAMM|nr:hypothetical protein [Pseudohalioglobus sediminis]KAA1188418.1 hypothetical protein F0M18_18145 [Pseudohalioglobus sediminis]
MNIFVKENRSFLLISELVKLDPKIYGSSSKELMCFDVVSGNGSELPKDSQFERLANIVIKTIMETKEKTKGATYGWIESVKCQFCQIEEGGLLSWCLVVFSDPSLDEAKQQQLHQSLADELFAAIEAENFENFDHGASASRLHNDTRGALKHFRKLHEHNDYIVQRAVAVDDGEGGKKVELVTSSTPLRKKKPPKKTASSFNGLTKIVAVDKDSLEITFRDVSGDAEIAYPDMRMKAKNEKQFELLNIAQAHGILLVAKFDYKAEGQEAFGTLKKDSVDFSLMNGQTINLIGQEGGYPIVTLSGLYDAGNDASALEDAG